MKHVGSIRTLPAEGKGHFYEENRVTKKQIIAELRKHQKIIAKSRDALRGVMEEVEEQFENADRAHDELEGCIEILSELV